MTAVGWLATSMQRWRGEEGDRVLTGQEATVLGRRAPRPGVSTATSRFRPAPVTGLSPRVGQGPEPGLASRAESARPTPHAA